MTTDTEYKWWEDWELMDRLLSYDPETGIIYAKERSECDFEDRGSGSSFILSDKFIFDITPVTFHFSKFLFFCLHLTK